MNTCNLITDGLQFPTWSRHGVGGRDKMRKIIEWKRRNADDSHEVHFMNADNHPAGFTVDTDGTTWRVVNVAGTGHMFVEAY